MVEGGLGSIVSNLPVLSVLLKERNWLTRLLSKAYILSGLFRFSSFKSSGEKINDDGGENGSGPRIRPGGIRGKNSDIEFDAMPLENVDTRPTTGSNRSQKQLLATVRYNNPLA